MSYTKLQPSYQFDRISSTGNKCLIEIAAPLVMGNDYFLESNTPFESEYDFLFVEAEIKNPGDGDPASNLPYKNNKETNNLVDQNMYDLYKKYKHLNKNPVIITAYPRSERYITFKLPEDGSILITNNTFDSTFVQEQKILNQFLESSSITPEMMKIIRLSSEGAKFNTYMADVISFLLKVNYFINPTIFEEVTLTPEIIKSNDPRLKNIIINDVPWFPKDGFDYLYYTNNPDKNVRQKFMFPRQGTIIYQQLWQLLSQEENIVKKNIRRHLNNTFIYQRWSDYSANDIDDAFTILAIINAYQSIPSLTGQEQSILTQFKKIIKPWYNQIYLQLTQMEPEPEPEENIYHQNYIKDGPLIGHK